MKSWPAVLNRPAGSAALGSLLEMAFLDPGEPPCQELWVGFSSLLTSHLLSLVETSPVHLFQLSKVPGNKCWDWQLLLTLSYIFVFVYGSHLLKKVCFIGLGKCP